jgi:hypothetical protein
MLRSRGPPSPWWRAATTVPVGSRKFKENLTENMTTKGVHERAAPIARMRDDLEAIEAL